MKNIYDGKHVPSSRVTNNGSAEKDESSTIQVDLGKEYVIAALILVDRKMDDVNHHQSNNWTIRIENTTDGNMGAICTSHVDAIGRNWDPVICENKPKGRYITILGSRNIELCDFQVLIEYGKILPMHLLISIKIFHLKY